MNARSMVSFKSNSDTHNLLPCVSQAALVAMAMEQPDSWRQGGLEKIVELSRQVSR